MISPPRDIDRGVFQRWGSPGTGKTTRMARDVRDCLDKGRRVLIATLTKTADAEIQRLQLPLPRGSARTVHAHFYHALGCPEIITIKHLQEWNEAFPHWAIRGEWSDDIDDLLREGDIANDGDRLRAHVDILRARCEPIEAWDEEAKAWLTAWSDFKRQLAVYDFTDLLEIGLKEIPIAPGEPHVILADEAQDLSRAELAVLRQWAEHAEALVLYGDPWQNLFSWRGTENNIFLEIPAPPEHRIQLGQSYRLPRAIHAFALDWMRREYSAYQELSFKPRDADGEVHPDAFYAKRPEWVLSEIEDHLNAGRSVMWLTTCAYQLAPALAVFRREGWPYHNPWRSRRGDWNPVRGLAKDALLAFTRPNKDIWGQENRWWTVGEVQTFARALQAQGVIVRGKKGDIEEIEDPKVLEQPMKYHGDWFNAWFVKEQWDAIMSGDPLWLRQHVLPKYRTRIEYPLEILQRRGPRALQEEPRLIVGTVHCSPPDEPVLTNEGWVPIGQLNPAIHGLATYHYKTNSLMWGHRHSLRGLLAGYPFIVAQRPYQGPMLTLETTHSRTQVTPEHRIRVRFAEKFMEKYVVYLMRRRSWWRVGICVSAHRPYKSGGVNGRMASEQAEAGWILGVYHTRAEALEAEAYIQGYFGIPGLTFEASTHERALTSIQLHAVHERMAPVVSKRARELLKAFGLDEYQPLYERAMPYGELFHTGRPRNKRGIFLTAAANIISDYMEVGVVPDMFIERKWGTMTYYKKVEWFPVNVTRTSYKGSVYSIDVPPHHHYVSGRIIVHNSVKGGEASSVFLAPDISPIAQRAWLEGGEARDEICRAAYVGMTRAKESLYLGSAKRGAVSW